MRHPLVTRLAAAAGLLSSALAGPGPKLPGQYLGEPDSVQLYPYVDLAHETQRQIIVDREPGQYLGHPSTILLEDGRTLLCVYPKGHGKGALVLKRSTDGGLTWSDRLPVPENWSTSLETPTIYRVVDAAGQKRLIVWSGLYPARFSLSSDDGRTWSPLQPAGDWGGIVVMGSLAPVRDQPGHYLAWFNDDGRFIGPQPKQTQPVTCSIYQTESADGGVTWSHPHAIAQSSTLLICEPGFVRSPDGRQIALLLREDSHNHRSQLILSNDEGRTWSDPQPLAVTLVGDRHVTAYAPDGRLVVAFRDTNRASPTNGDWFCWVGTYNDLVHGRAGAYRVRLMENRFGWDCGYSGLHALADGTMIATTYGHWTAGEEPYIVSVRFTLAELDAKLAAQPHP